MATQVIQHRPRPLDVTILRSLEFENDCPHCPDGRPDVVATCENCGSTMVFRGVGKLRSGLRVHYFECVHSPREVHSVSFLIAD